MLLCGVSKGMLFNDNFALAVDMSLWLAEMAESWVMSCRSMYVCMCVVLLDVTMVTILVFPTLCGFDADLQFSFLNYHWGKCFWTALYFVANFIDNGFSHCQPKHLLNCLL